MIRVFQEFEAILKNRLGDGWEEWKNGSKSTASYMDFMGKTWEGIKQAYDTKESQKPAKYLSLIELPQSLTSKLSAPTKK